MSLITRCPACATMFKVVPDQLRVSDGWVRCGQCAEVFDANANLHTGTVVAVVATEPRVEPEAEPFLTVDPRALDIEQIDAGDAPQEPKLDLGSFTDKSPATDAPPVMNQEQAKEDDVLEHAFLRPDSKPVRGGRRSVRIGLALLSVLMGLALVLQVVIRERDWLVAVEPASRRVLAPLCEWVGCEVAPLRRIESVVIDSSSFTKVRMDAYRLSFTLKNTSPTPLATPALELTLTNLQDQAVVRRVFVSADLGDKTGVIEPGAELVVNLPLAIKLGSNAEKISGYRLLSFYP